LTPKIKIIDAVSVEVHKKTKKMPYPGKKRKGKAMDAF
jgi:hypothetical protein